MVHLHPKPNCYAQDIENFLPFIYENLISALLFKQKYQTAPKTKFLVTPLILGKLFSGNKLY